jgi:hypothetical protein
MTTTNDVVQEEYARATLEPYRTLWDHYYFAQAHERQEEGWWAQQFLEDNMDHHRTQAERNLGTSEELVERTRRWQEETDRVLAKESTNAYEGFLDSLFLYYRQSVRAVEKESALGPL